MQRSLAKYLQDMVLALQAVEEYISGKDYQDYVHHRQLRSSVEREFLIVGEAMAKIIHRFPETKSRLEHARRVANFRHLLVHEYSNINDLLVWDIAQRSAPILLLQVQSWLGELDHSTANTSGEKAR